MAVDSAHPNGTPPPPRVVATPAALELLADLARVLGLVEPGGWRIGTAPTHYRAEPCAALPWMQPPQATITLFAAHQEQVLQPPPEATVLGGDDFAPAAALRVGRHVFTTQYHPELSREFMQALLDEYGALWPAPMVAQARLQVQQPVDAGLFMRWAAQFLEQEASENQ